MRSGFGHLDDLNRYIVEDHLRNPRNSQPVSNPDAEATIDNPFCGDEVSVQIRLQDDRLASICVVGSGCAITQVSASIMGEIVAGRECLEISQLSNAMRRMLSDGVIPEGKEEEGLGDAVALRDVSRFPVRIKCALLAWATLEDALASCRG